jgi:hypothetical protein
MDYGYNLGENSESESDLDELLVGEELERRKTLVQRVMVEELTKIW